MRELFVLTHSGVWCVVALLIPAVLYLKHGAWCVCMLIPPVCMLIPGVWYLKHSVWYLCTDSGCLVPETGVWCICVLVPETSKPLPMPGRVEVDKVVLTRSRSITRLRTVRVLLYTVDRGTLFIVDLLMGCVDGVLCIS